MLSRIVGVISSRGVQRDKVSKCADFVNGSNSRHCRRRVRSVGNRRISQAEFDWTQLGAVQEGTCHVKCNSSQYAMPCHAYLT